MSTGKRYKFIGSSFGVQTGVGSPVDVTAATELIVSPPWQGDALLVPGHAVQLQMWPPDPHPLRFS